MFSIKHNNNNHYFQIKLGKNFIRSGQLIRRKRSGVFRTLVKRNFFVPLLSRTINIINPRRFNKKFLLRLQNKFGRFFLKKNIRAHRRFLKRLNRNFFHFFLKKIGVHKHRFFLNKYFLKYQRLWNYSKKRNSKSIGWHWVVANKTPRFVLKPYDFNSNQRAFNILLQSSLNLKCFSAGPGFSYSDNNPVLRNSIDFLKKAGARLLLAQSPLSGSRFLKYVVLFSKKGNQRGLFNLIFKNFLAIKLLLFKNIIKHFFYQFNNKYNNIFIKSVTSGVDLFYLKAKFSTLFRRLVFGQTSNISSVSRNILPVVSSPVSTKFSRVFSTNLFLTSIRLLNELLSTFRVYIEVKPWKKSGRPITVPAPIKSHTRRSFIFSHWFKESVLSKSNTDGGFALRAFNEFIDISKLEGDSIKKLNNLSKIIQTNKAFIRKSGMRIV